MKILVYAPTVGRGGVHRVVETLMDGFNRVSGVNTRFDVLGQTYDEIGLKIEWPEAWDFEQLDPGPTIPKHPEQFQWLYSQQETFVAHLARRAPDYDLVFCPSPWWTMRVKEWPMQKLGVPFVTVVADFAFDHIEMGLLAYNFRHVAKLIAQQADFTVFLSDWQRKWGEDHYNFKHTATIHHSADFVAKDFVPTGDEAVRVGQKYGLPARYILAFHPMHHKGILDVLPAFKIARGESSAVPPLVVAGINTEHLFSEESIDSHIDEVRVLLKDIGAVQNDNVFALGRIPGEDIAGLYVGAEASVVASHSDGTLSGAIFESMAASTPLIFSNLPVFTEELGTDNRYGLMFPVGDIPALAKAIVKVCEGRPSAHMRAMEAFGFTNKRSHLDVAREYLTVFEQVTKRGDDEQHQNA